ncbi:MAG: carbon-nitrogen hydrolase family protein [Halieaceae bacterium]
MSEHRQLTVALAQLAPVWLDRAATLEKILAAIDQAAAEHAQLVCFGESLLPGYPFWLERTDGAVFESPQQKELHAFYLAQAVSIEEGHLQPVCQRAAQHGITVILGTAERAGDRGGHSIYCSLVYIDAEGEILHVHRKLMPTYEERLTWSPGDGHGLRTHPLGAFTVGALNCWENWMPLPRAALYAQGEDLHVAIWPGAERNTHDITRFMAKEGRSFVISVSGLMRPSDVPMTMPQRDEILLGAEDFLADGGSCIAGPGGEWVLEPQTEREGVFIATLDQQRVLEERQNFDPAGHYSRPDVTRLEVNRERQRTVHFSDD